MPALSKYTPELGIDFCGRLSTSPFGMEVVCAELGLVPRTVWRWLSAHPDFWDIYTRARDFQTELLYDEISRVAYLPLTNNGESEEDGGIRLSGAEAMAEITRRKLIVDTLKFKLAKLQPKRFGDNQNVTVDVNMRKVVTADQFEVLREELRKKRIAPPVEDADIEDV